MSDTREEQTPEIRDRVHAELRRDKRLSQITVAREAGVSPSALNRWLKGTYEGDNAAVEHKVRRWLETTHAARSESAALPEAPDYVETPTGGKVVQALGYAQLAGDIAVVYGGAGVGKTTAIRRYAQQAPNVFVATMTPASASVVTALEEICEALSITATGGAAKLHRAIVRRLAGTRGLLVIDEAQHLSVAALDQVRSIHDAVGIGVALVGNEQVYARMAGGNRAAYLDRLYSRIGKRVRVTAASKADIGALIDAWGIADTACRKDITDIASRPGALRVLTKVLRLAASYATAAGRELCCDDVRQAWRELGGE
jgi:DNA transposition AAA+ family ATPase